MIPRILPVKCYNGSLCTCGIIYILIVCNKYQQLADLAFQGLLPHLKDKYASQEFESLSHLVQTISNQDNLVFEPRRN